MVFPSPRLSVQFLLALAYDSSSSSLQVHSPVSPPASLATEPRAWCMPSLPWVKCNQAAPPPSPGSHCPSSLTLEACAIFVFHVGPLPHLIIETYSAWWPGSVSSTAGGELGFVDCTDIVAVTLLRVWKKIRIEDRKKRETRHRQNTLWIPISFCAGKKLPWDTLEIFFSDKEVPYNCVL